MRFIYISILPCFPVHLQLPRIYQILSFLKFCLFCPKTKIISRTVLTTDSAGGFPPASSNSTFQLPISLNRLATTEPELPDPTTMKSYSPRPKIEYIVEFRLLSAIIIYRVDKRTNKFVFNFSTKTDFGHIWKFFRRFLMKNCARTKCARPSVSNKNTGW